MASIKIRPISDLRNNYASVEEDVKKGPVFLTKNGYGTLVTMTIEEYERISDPLERLLDEVLPHPYGTRGWRGNVQEDKG